LCHRSCWCCSLLLLMLLLLFLLPLLLRSSGIHISKPQAGVWSNTEGAGICRRSDRYTWYRRFAENVHESKSHTVVACTLPTHICRLHIIYRRRVATGQLTRVGIRSGVNDIQTFLISCYIAHVRWTNG
jgi:hypothetical protein